MRWIVIAALLGATPALAANDGEAKLQRALAGKVAGQPLRCIQPDLSAQPVIYDGVGILYHRGRTTYVGRLQGACPALREDRTIIVRGQGGLLCRNDPVRIHEATGADFGFCAFSGFTPYTK